MKRRGQQIFDPKERIMSRVTIHPNGCWVWGASKRRRYGRLTVGSREDGSRRMMSAHRYSLMVFKGIEVPSSMDVCHSCDNPPCVNPDHLWVGTRQDNVDDRERKGRNINLRGSRNPLSKLTEWQVIEIRRLRSTMSLAQLAKMFGVSRKTILDVAKNRLWRHVSPAPPSAPDPQTSTPEESK